MYLLQGLQVDARGMKAHNKWSVLVRGQFMVSIDMCCAETQGMCNISVGALASGFQASALARTMMSHIGQFVFCGNMILIGAPQETCRITKEHVYKHNNHRVCLTMND